MTDRRRFRWLCVVACHLGFFGLSVLAPIAKGAEYFVDPGGSNLANGSAGAPWQTLQHAANAVGPGDRVVAQPGSYAAFRLLTSGAPNNPIEFFAQPGVLIDQYPNAIRDGINLEGTSHVVLDGFSITGASRAGVRTVGPWNGGLLGFADFVTVRNVRAYDNGKWGIFTGFVNDLLIENNETSGSAIEHGIYVSNSGDRPTVRNNLVWGNRGNGIHMNSDLSSGLDGIITDAVISGNVIHDNGLGGGSGINMDGVQNSRVENNLLYNNHATGIALFRIDGAEGAKNNQVLNNTVLTSSAGRWALTIAGGSTGNTVMNNVFYSEHSFRGAMDISPDSMVGLQSDYNAVEDRFTEDGGDSNIVDLAAWQTQTGQETHSQAIIPSELFANLATDDYHLKAGSPAIDTGTSTLAPLVDLEGAARPAGAGFDIGAYEFGANLWSADFDGSNHVDGDDLTQWTGDFGVNASSDADNDGDSDGADFLAWQRQFGNGAGVQQNVQSIPEPSSLVLLCSIATWLLPRRGKGGKNPSPLFRGGVRAATNLWPHFESKPSPSPSLQGRGIAGAPCCHQNH